VSRRGAGMVTPGKEFTAEEQSAQRKGCARAVLAIPRAVCALRAPRNLRLT